MGRSQAEGLQQKQHQKQQKQKLKEQQKPKEQEQKLKEDNRSLRTQMKSWTQDWEQLEDEVGGCWGAASWAFLGGVRLSW